MVQRADNMGHLCGHTGVPVVCDGQEEELRSRREMEDEMRQMEKMNPDLDDVIDKGVEDAESAGGDDDDDDAPVRPLNQ